MNIKMQCCGLILLVVIGFFYYRQKKVNLSTERAFLRIFHIIAMSLVLDILSIVALNYADQLPELLVTIICKSYISSLVLVAMNGVLYLFSDIYSQSRRYRKRQYIFTGIATLAILLIIMLPIYKNLEDKNNTFTYGPSVIVTYVFCMSFFAVMVFLLIREKRKMNAKRREAVNAWIIIWLTSAGIQFLYNKLLLVGFAGAISVMIIYLKLENPETNLDRLTGLFNQTALLQYMRQMFSKGADFTILSIELPLFRNNVAETVDVRLEMIRFISSMPNSIAFKGSDYEVILVFSSKEDAEHAEELLDDRFSFGWGKHKEVMLNPEYLLMPSVKIVNQPENVIPCLRYAMQHSMNFAESGRGVVNEDIANQMYEERLIEQLIEDAIKNDWIEVFYQPIYSISEKKFVSAEALCRIVDQEGNIAAPGSFIEIAEKNGTILRLGEQVFRKVCHFIASEHPEKLGIQYIEVNLSVVQCSYEYLADSFIEIMEWYQIPPSMINLEITESGSLLDRRILLDNMNKLKEYGVSFSLDDFGTGYSNLNYIVDMPVDIVKFDRSMIVSYFENGKARYVMDAAMHMIHDMKLHIVSEGIETKEQLDTMEELDISYIQGYYFSKPIPTEAFLTFLEKNNNT